MILHSAFRRLMKSPISSALMNPTNLPCLVIDMSVSPSVMPSISRTSFGMTICHLVPTVTEPCILTPIAAFAGTSFLDPNIERKVRKVIQNPLYILFYPIQIYLKNLLIFSYYSYNESILTSIICNSSKEFSFFSSPIWQCSHSSRS